MQQKDLKKLSHYKTLGLEPDADEVEIKQAYRRLAKKYHPDINPSPEAHNRFIEITEAYEILINKSLQSYFMRKKADRDPDTLRAEYKKARQAAKENAQKYARMKYEKFKKEQEAFKISGWHDVILTLKYFIRTLVFPIIALFIALPLISEQVAEQPSGYVIFWLLATILMLFVLNNCKKYFRLGSYYYSVSGILSLLKKSATIIDRNCYYCLGEKAILSPYKIELFRIRNVRLKSYGHLYGRTAGIDRKFKTARIPRSRKAFLVHSLCSLVKILSIIFCLVWIKTEPWSHLGLAAGIILGSVLSGIISIVLHTRFKVSYLLSAGMLIKIFFWVVGMYFFGEYAFLGLFFDPIIEAILRFLSRDRLFIPLLDQHPGLTALLRSRYQFYLELPVWSVINPFFRWLF